MTTEHPNLTFTWFEDTFEGYMAQKQDNGDDHKFHFLVCLNGLHYFDDWACAVDQFYDLVLPGGVMTNTIDSGDSACGMLFTKYREWEGNPMNLLTAHDITSYMKRKGLNYQIYLREGAVDVAEVFDDKSAEGNMILDFLVQRKDFRKNARKELLKTVLDFVMEHSHEEKGKRFMSDDEIEIVVIKSA
ncbi:histamine N-methyltransferase-like isoform X1 [Ptychodera flava]|uniref:histamine N-methyltransferase-like isoform X1 n=1 Tax=Ptychodera flava TaxID=63121 RepID=UPI00396AA4A9